MALTGTEVISRAAAVLIDPAMVRWSSDELLGYLNEGRQQAAVLRPDLYAVTVDLELVDGSVQTLPAGGFKLLDVYYNLSASGTLGVSPRIVERELLDAMRPGWRAEAAGAIKHFMYDERDSRSFDVYPPAAAGQKLRVRYAADPTPIAADDPLTLEGPYAVFLIDYVVGRAYAKDAEYGGNRELAGQYLDRFVAGLSAGVSTETAVSPNTANQGGVPSRAAAMAGA